MLCHGATMTQPFRISAEITKRDDERQVVYGWASVIENDGVPVTDRQGDVIPEGELIAAAHRFMMDRTAGLMHKRDGNAPLSVGEVVESVVLTRDVQAALGIDLRKSGWFIGMKIHDPAVWAAVKSGQLTAFSVGGRGTRETI